MCLESFQLSDGLRQARPGLGAWGHWLPCWNELADSGVSTQSELCWRKGAPALREFFLGLRLSRDQLHSGRSRSGSDVRDSER